MIRYLLAAFGCFLSATAIFAQANATIPDPDPEIERKTFIVPEGFEVTLYAADPLLAKPIQMNFDPQGRLWVASSEVYPQIKPGQKANDKIIILEDTNGDGKADKTTVFADGLLIPTGVAPGDGGAYVANSTELVHLKASKPGEKADQSRVVLSGFGTEDTHHILHTFRWGPEGCLYMNQSIYIHSHLETPHGVKRLNGGGIWRYRPETMQLDVLAKGFVNTWGHEVDAWGQSFATDGAYGEGINHVLPGAYYVTAVGATKIWKGLNTGSPKHCGLEIVNGRHLPDDWQGDMITNDFRGHRVCRFKLSEDGTSYTSREMTEVIKSNHPAFRPIDVKMGPDGAIYIADWYNPIIQHGEVDFRDPRRDHVHGRIWRVTAKGRPLVKKPDLVGATTPELLERLKDPELWTRSQAKQVLKERGAKEVIPALDAWIAKLDRANAEYEHLVLEAMWTYLNVGVADEKGQWLKPARELLRQLETAKDYRARAVAARIHATTHPTAPEAADVLTTLATDDHPRVRMEAIRGLAEFPQTPNVLDKVLQAMNKPVDRALDYELWLTVRELEPVWMPKFRAGEDVFKGNVKGMTFTMQALGNASAALPLLQLVKAGKIPKDREAAAWELIAQTGGQDEIGQALAFATQPGLPPATVSPVLDAIESSARDRKIRPMDKYITPAFKSIVSPSPLTVYRSRLAGLWKVESERPSLELLATAKEFGPAEQRAAFDGLLSMGGEPTKKFILNAATAGPDDTRKLAIIALSGIDQTTAATFAAAWLAKAKATDDVSDVFAAFLNRKGGSPILAKALEGKSLPPDVAKVGLRTLRSSVQDAKPLQEALTKAGNLTAPKTEVTPEELKAYVNEVALKGDAKRGELVYRRKEATCLACHAIAGAGGQVGPDMTSIGASAQVDYLVESIFNPNKAVKEGYNAIKVTTNSGKVIVGIKTREAEGKLTLRTIEDKEITIADKDIDEKSASRSMMPDGLADQFTRQEFVDLVRFLSELGKQGPYAPSKARVVRRWQQFEPTLENMNQLRRGRAALAAETPDAFTWSSVYSMVNGEFPKSDMPKLTVWNGSAPISLLRAQLDVTTAGPVKLKINNAKGLTLYVGSTPVAVKEEMILDLKVGLQNLTFGVDYDNRVDGLRVELDDVPGSPVKVAIVNGK
ncbi:PVC-type heme-binding CxxCH protein [Zavarzinella formosa]|uniref:PVC-type heme-binding CxxCH protein n=1 Tax=Zavarzinella formosa TaxID=360055 RepID=UPI0002EBA844|nr:PVC-type heme-binding CxxCH protein [Zavarzinella formosa]